jgi:hypothetical protein
MMRHLDSFTRGFAAAALMMAFLFGAEATAGTNEKDGAVVALAYDSGSRDIIAYLETQARQAGAAHPTITPQ